MIILVSYHAEKWALPYVSITRMRDFQNSGSRPRQKSDLEAEYGASSKFLIAKTTRDKAFGIKSDCIKQILESYFP